MTNSATLAAVGDTLSVAQGPLAGAAIGGGAKYQPPQDSPILAVRDAALLVSYSGTFAGAKLEIVRVRPNQVQEVIDSHVSPADNATGSVRIDFPAGAYSDFRCRILKLTSGSIAITLATSKS